MTYPRCDSNGGIGCHPSPASERPAFDSLWRQIFIVPTRDPLARSVSSFNFDHPIGGGSDDVLSVVEDWKALALPDGCTSECGFCVEYCSSDENLGRSPRP